MFDHCEYNIQAYQNVNINQSINKIIFFIENNISDRQLETKRKNLPKQMSGLMK